MCKNCGNFCYSKLFAVCDVDWTFCTDQFEQGHADAITPSDSSGKPNGKQGQKVSIQLIHLQRMDHVMKLSQI
jgi:hypothetical protein